ncbi:MAG: orotate phosphoribosyltransferase [Bacteroidota bacterium]
MSATAHQIAQYLLQIKAVRLSPQTPFTWASGWKSPIYCDNRQLLSYPEIRSAVADSFAEHIRSKFELPVTVAGVATAGIPHAALIAERLGVPMVYVRSQPKGHGMGNQIEGKLTEGQPVIVIEDLISTGGSSAKAVEALQAAGAEVVSLLAIFSYGFPQSAERFEQMQLSTHTLTNLDALVAEAIKMQYLSEAEMASLQAWQKDPANWQPA